LPTNRTIAVSEETKKKLISMKVYPRETFDDTINRLMDEHKKLQKESKQKLDRD